MAVMPMKRISIYALKNRRKQILELIQRRGVVEIDDRKADETVFAKMDTVPAKSRFENNAAALQSALDALDKLEPPEKSLFASLNGRDAIPLSKYQETADGAGELLKIASRINTLSKSCADKRPEILRLQTQICALEPWMKLDISMRTISTPTTSVFTGSFPVEYTEETLRAKIAEGAPDVDGVVVEILSASPQQTCAFLMCHISQGLKLETYLRSIGFTYPAEPSKVPPAERVDKQRSMKTNRKYPHTKTHAKTCFTPSITLRCAPRNTMFWAAYGRARTCFSLRDTFRQRTPRRLRRSSRPRRKPTWSCATRVTRTMCP